MIYIGEKRKRRGGAARIGVGIGKRRKIAGKEILFKKTFSTLSVEEGTRAEGGDSGKKVEKCTRAEEGDCSQGSARYASCYFFYYFGIPVYIHLRFSGCFQEAVLADWSGH